MAAGWIAVGVLTLWSNLGTVDAASRSAPVRLVWIGLGLVLIAGGLAIAVRALRRSGKTPH